MGVFELVEENSDQVIVKVNADDLLIIARHPYVNSKMRYINMTKGEDNTFTIVNDDGSTWSMHEGRHGMTIVSENNKKLKMALKCFLRESHVYYDVKSGLNPYAAEFYQHKGAWYVNLMFADTKQTSRVYFPADEYSAEDIVERGLVKYNKRFKGRSENVIATPNGNVGTVYMVEIGNE